MASRAHRLGSSRLGEVVAELTPIKFGALPSLYPFRKRHPRDGMEEERP